LRSPCPFHRCSTDRRESSRVISEIPDISIRIRRRDRYAPLENLTIKELGQIGKQLHMRFESKDGDDFGAERLEFSVFHDLVVKDMGTAESADRICGGAALPERILWQWPTAYP
jgi:hypothetical protein